MIRKCKLTEVKGFCGVLEVKLQCTGSHKLRRRCQAPVPTSATHRIAIRQYAHLANKIMLQHLLACCSRAAISLQAVAAFQQHPFNSCTQPTRDFACKRPEWRVSLHTIAHGSLKSKTSHRWLCLGGGLTPLGRQSPVAHLPDEVFQLRRRQSRDWHAPDSKVCLLLSKSQREASGAISKREVFRAKAHPVQPPNIQIITT